MLLAFLLDAYDEEVLTDSKGKEDVRTVLRLHPALAPYKAAVLPLAKKLAPVAEPIYEELTKHFSVSASGTEEKMRSVHRSPSAWTLTRKQTTV